MRRSERLTTRAADAWRATFAPDEAPGAMLPPGWEGLEFPFDTSFAGLRADGSPAADGVLPDVDLPRRLYVGEDTVFHAPLPFGAEVEQVSRAGALVERIARDGRRLVFADVEREYRVDGVLAIESTWHDVFLEAAAEGAPPPRPVPAPEGPADWSQEVRLDSRQLFRFSAITFNTHRVHYDRDWAQRVERLPDLLVHGPLTRLLLLDAARRHDDRAVAAWSFRAVAPNLVDRPFRIEGRAADAEIEVVAVGSEGLLARGTATWR